MARLAASLLFFAAAWLPLGASGQIVSHIRSSTPDGQQGKLDLELGTSDLGLRADMALRDQRDGGTQARSSLATSWAPLPQLDLKTVVHYANLNMTGSDPAIDTSIVVKPDLGFLNRVEASVHRAAAHPRDSVLLRFTEFDKPFDLLGDHQLGLRADVKVERTGEQSRAASNLESTLSFGDAFRIRSALQLENALGSSLQRSTLDTRMVYTTPFSHVDNIEGRIQRGLNGRSQSLAVLFSAPFNLTGKALLRESVRADGLAARSLGVETKVSGAFASVLGGQSALNLNLERDLEAAGSLETSLAYDHEWTPADQTSVALKLKLLKRTESETPSMGLSWSTRF